MEHPRCESDEPRPQLPHGTEIGCPILTPYASKSLMAKRPLLKRMTALPDWHQRTRRSKKLIGMSSRASWI